MSGIARQARSPQRILLVIHALTLGGAERVLAVMANHWAEHGREVHVVTLSEAHEPFAPLSPCVRLHHLGVAGTSGSLSAAARANLRRIFSLRRIFRDIQPDCVIAFMDTTSALCILAALGTGCPVIAAEHIDPNAHSIGRIWGAIRRAVYPLASAVVVLTASARDFFPQALQRRICVIPNPVARHRQGQAVPQNPGARRTLITMGRLAPQKGFDILLEAFAPLARRFPDWRLVILGEGPEREHLESLRHDSDLDGLAELPGAATDPFPLLAQADLFVLPSRFEGFPMALCEALACGLPCVAFDCPSGPAEIVRHGVDGLLVPPGDVDALTGALSRLMADADLRAGMAARAPEVLERFGVEKVLNMWETLLASIARDKDS